MNKKQTENSQKETEHRLKAAHKTERKNSWKPEIQKQKRKTQEEGKYKVD
jgi:hypothetical protein